MRSFLFPVQIIAEHLDDAWHQALRKCFEFGHEYTVTHGSYEGQKRYEFDFITIVIKRPWEQIIPLMPEGLSSPPPASREQIETYMADYLFMDKKCENEDYRYGERIVNPKLRSVVREDLSKPHEKSFYVYEGQRSRENLKLRIDSPIQMGCNQYNEVIRKFKYAGEGTNQCTIEIAMPNDILLTDPPCLRLIDCRLRYGKLHFIVYFRSWDLYAGFPVNLGGLELLKQMMADEIGVKNGSMVTISKGLHIYSQYYEIVECQIQMPIEKLRQRGGEKIRQLNV